MLINGINPIFYLIILLVIKMDQSKELTKMIKGIKMAIYVFTKLEKKNQTVDIHNQIVKSLEIFRSQMDLMIKDASMADYRVSIETTEIPKMTRWMMKLKLKAINTPAMVKKEAVKGLKMGVYQGNQFLEKHPHLDANFRKQIEQILQQYKQLINNFNKIYYQ